jgi:hypothetical protein
MPCFPLPASRGLGFRGRPSRSESSTDLSICSDCRKKWIGIECGTSSLERALLRGRSCAPFLSPRPGGIRPAQMLGGR